uniref:Tropomyosin-1, isoforms 9A/A/B n=2 Tax=Schistosoma japonicum TaxID=6182 RepID=C1LKP1_SCHJA|nr:Tropomyosin-1, isoforms 9A/A/B [Schistosoma japonicum]CAX75269.1 Tropomyosin-1, isoforms 9A/A/B [Schistosoma japonicum]CAX75270.1 Tropomyosin-1, isoforms 9A/A/B [Schistosoma japonicum]
MDVLRRRLNEFREEEDNLRGKVSDIEAQIKCVVDETYKVNSEQYELASKEMLLKQKCQVQNDRLINALNKLSDHRDSHDQHSRKLNNLNNKNYSQDSKMDELEAELSRLRSECLEIQARVDETVIHLKHVEFAKENAEKRANATESKVQDLELQHTSTLEALKRAELSDMQYLSTDDLETKEKNLREQLQRAIDTYENSERNIVTLDRQIKSRKAELLKQRNENEKLKKEIELFLKEMHDI